MKILIFFIFISCMFSIIGQDIQFSNESLFYLRYVDPESCDEPYNLPEFYSFEEWSKLKYNGTVNEKKLIAFRTWNEETTDNDVVVYTEKITVEFGSTENEYRNVLKSSYIRWANYLEVNDVVSLTNDSWQELYVSIDYEKNQLKCKYIPQKGDSALCVSIKNHTTENVKSLKSLCIFYANDEIQNTAFTIQKIKEEKQITTTSQTNSLGEMFQNLKSNSVIELQPGMYNISELDTNKSGPHYRWSYYLEGRDYAWGKTMLTFSNLENITLKGLGESPSDSKVYTEDSEAIVLVFENCKNVTIENLWLGHITASESCLGGVLSFNDCEEVKINQTEMYGTGFYGFEAYNSKNIVCTESEIWDCTGGAFHLYDCETAIIENCYIHDNTSRSHFTTMSGCSNIIVSNCIWSDNIIDDSAVESQSIFCLWDADLRVTDCEFKNNHVESFILRKKTDKYETDKLIFLDNIINGETESFFK